MATDIFEDSKVALKGAIVAGHENAHDVVFTLYRNGKSVDAVSAKIKDAKAAGEKKAPAVNGDEDNYTLTYKMTVEGKEYDGAESWTVWPRKLKLTVTHAIEKKPFANFAVTIKHAGADTVVRTLKDGTFTFFLKKPEKFEIAAVPPGEITAWTDDKGPERACKALRRFKAEFVAPTKPADGKIKQYVNLATKDKGRDGNASTVVVRVGAEGDAKKKAAQRVGQQNDIVYLQAKFSRATKRNSPLPTLDKVTDKTEEDSGKTVKAKVFLGKDGEAATFTLELGITGGDTCELKIGSTDACADATLTFTNWRKLYHQITRPDGLAAPGFGAMTGSLAKVFVEYEKYKELTFKEADKPAAPAGSWFDGAMLGGGLAGRCVNIGEHNKMFFHGKFVDEHKPLGVHVLMCHAQFDTQKSFVESQAPAAIDSTTAKISFPLGGAASVYGVLFLLNADGTQRKKQVLPMSFLDGKQGVRNVKWRCLAATGKYKGKKGPVPDDHVSVDYPNNPQQIAIKLPAEASTMVDDGEKVSITFDYHYARGPWAGEADGVKGWLQLIRTGDDNAINGTCTHELGHTMGQVIKAVPPGMDLADHGWKYEFRGHQGPHCAFGVSQADYDAGGSLVGHNEAKCVMFGALRPKPTPTDYCAKCEPFVRSAALTSLH